MRPDTSQLCHFCKQINFTAILTPREYNHETGVTTTIFRPDLAGNGESPDLKWWGFGKTKRTGDHRSYLPQIRTAYYEDLTSSSGSEIVLEEPEIPGAPTEDCRADPDLGLDTNDEDWSDYESSGSSATADGEAIEVPPASDVDASSSHLPSRSQQDSDHLNTPPYQFEIEENIPPITPGEVHVDNSGVLATGDNPNEIRQDFFVHDPHDEDFDDRYESEDDCSEKHGSASTWSNWSHFTEIQRVDVEKQEKRAWNYRWSHLYYLGSIWDVRSRRKICCLCRYFWLRMRKNPIVKDLYITKSRCVIKCVEFKCKRSEGSPGPKREPTMLNLVGVYGIKLGDPGAKEWMLKMPFVLQGAHTETNLIDEETLTKNVCSFRDGLFGEARLRGELCDLDLFKKWLSFCETKHDHTVFTEDQKIVLRLIDVKDLRIVELRGQAVDLPRFVALSYIWGVAAQKLVLKTTNLAQLQQKDALQNVELNETIRDAIDLVAALDEQYIWIDALCILQDSEEDKQEQIPFMHLIYGRAILTIIAAHGIDADAGLPGLRPETRKGNIPAILELDDIKVSVRSTTEMFHTHEGLGIVENYLRQSMYITRGWTFQEAHLSTRSLIFTRKQVYWECPMCTWCEETHWESECLQFYGQRAVYDPTPEDIWLDNFDRRYYDLESPGDEIKPEAQRNSYANLVRSYSGRQLTHAADILNAFTGVLALIEAREQSRFLLALRERYFGNDLLWNSTTPNQMRGLSGSDGNPLWPSWTWLSWQGIIEIPNEPRHTSYDPIDNLKPSDGVRCYILQKGENDQIRLRVVNSDGGWRFDEGYARQGGGIFDPSWFKRRQRQMRDSPSTEDEANMNKGEKRQAKSKISLPALNNPSEDSEDTKQNQALPSLRGLVESKPKRTLDLSADQGYAEHSGEVESEEPDERQDTIDLSEVIERIQDITLADIESHPAYRYIRPNFHICFFTYSTPVILRSSESRRELYIDHGASENFASDAELDADDDQGEAQSYGWVQTSQPGLGFGPGEATLDSLLDGKYECLHMNDNQSPQFGHMLVSYDENGVARRQGMAVGPTIIDERKHRAVWKLIVLG